MGTLGFIKMHGLGNDFVVVDARVRQFAPSAAEIRALADRRTGIGFDQLITLETPNDAGADIAIRIHNADGGEVEACGNATRCVAKLVAEENNTETASIQTPAGVLHARIADPGDMISVDMGPARLAWQDIPLAAAADTLALPIESGPLRHGVAVNIGNPHAVFFVANAQAVDLAEHGPRLEHDPLFSDRANIGIAQVIDRGNIRLRVWERGVGITRACGTGACAAAVAGVRRDLTDRRVDVRLDGGTLGLQWRDDGHVVMTGPATRSFTGHFPASCPA